MRHLAGNARANSLRHRARTRAVRTISPSTSKSSTSTKPLLLVKKVAEITETKPAKPDRNRTQDNYALEQLDQQRARGLEHLHTLREIRGRGLCANLRSRAKAHLAVILKPLNPARSECGDIPARKTPIYAGAFLNFVMI